jgi:hypothetical protein
MKDTKRLPFPLGKTSRKMDAPSRKNNKNPNIRNKII